MSTEDTFVKSEETSDDAAPPAPAPTTAAKKSVHVKVSFQLFQKNEF